MADITADTPYGWRLETSLTMLQGLASGPLGNWGQGSEMNTVTIIRGSRIGKLGSDATGGVEEGMRPSASRKSASTKQRVPLSLVYSGHWDCIRKL